MAQRPVHVNLGSFRACSFMGDDLLSSIQRFATPDEIPAVVTFLASPFSIAVNRAAVRADGGIVRSLV